MADPCLVSNSRQGRDCVRSLNATRIAWGRPPVAAPCSTCGEVCAVPQACEQPMAEIPHRIERRLFAKVSGFLPTTDEGWGRFIGGALGLAGAIFIGGHVARYLGLF
jgi:hypothetical protein